MTNVTKNRRTLHFIARCGVLTAISFILYLPAFELMLPFLPPWLKLDLSALPVMLAGFALGPAGALAVQAAKSVLHLFWSTSGGIGELADLIMGLALTLPAAITYGVRKDRTGALIGMGVGIVLAIGAGVLSNMYIMLPMYTASMGMDAVLGAAGGANNAIVDVRTYVIYGVVPFNLIKGVVVSVVTLLLYKYVSPLLHEKKTTVQPQKRQELEEKKDA